MGHGFALYAGVAPEIIRATAREAEGLGYSSFWVNHPGPMDGLGALAHAATDTRRIELGIGVIPLHTRGPESITEGVKRHALPLDRLLLGVGSPNPEALKRVRAGLAPSAIRSRRDYRRRARSEDVPARRRGRRRRAPQLAHTRARAGLRRSRARGRGGGEAAAPKIFAYVRLAIGEAGRAKLAEEGDRYGVHPRLRRQLRAHGRKPVATASPPRTRGRCPRALARWRGAVDEVVLRAITAKDTVEENLILLRAAKP